MRWVGVEGERVRRRHTHTPARPRPVLGGRPHALCSTVNHLRAGAPGLEVAQGQAIGARRRVTDIAGQQTSSPKMQGTKPSTAAQRGAPATTAPPPGVAADAGGGGVGAPAGVRRVNAVVGVILAIFAHLYLTTVRGVVRPELGGAGGRAARRAAIVRPSTHRQRHRPPATSHSLSLSSWPPCMVPPPAAGPTPWP